MGNLIRRNKAVPVQAHRVNAAPEQIAINGPDGSPISNPVFPGSTTGFTPGAAQPQQPASPQGTTQNIFYINAQPPAPVGAPAPPQEIHYHTQVHHAPRPRTPDRTTSSFGMISVLLGGAACAAMYLPQISPYARLLAEAGLMAGGLGWLGAILFRRTGAGMPIFGLIVSAIGFILWLAGTGQLPATVDKLKSQLPAALPTIDINAPKAGNAVK